MIYLTSDTHFNHKNIISYCSRPFANVEEMNREIIKRWNHTVKKDDVVYHLGDFAWGDKDEVSRLVHRLNGRVRLILGNHDMKPPNWYLDAGFDRVYDLPVVLDHYFILSHRPPEFVNECSPFAWIYGHVHNSEPYLTASAHTACVCQERWDYRPVALDELVAYMEATNDTYVKGEE